MVHLIGLVVDAQEGESIYDPTCGTGGMLLECIEHLRQAGRDYRTLRMYGQEKNLTTSTIARMNMFLHGIEDFDIARGDTLRYPAFLRDDQLRQFDCVVANPPFSLKEWGAENWVNDPYGRNIAGVPPKGNGDMAWVQHMIRSMRPDTGRMAVVLPHGALFRKGAEGKIRQTLIEADLLEAVIGMGPNIFYGTTLAACILVFRAKKQVDRAGKVLFIDGSDQIRVGRAQNFLEPQHVETIYGWYNAFADEPNRAKVVDWTSCGQKSLTSIFRCTSKRRLPTNYRRWNMPCISLTKPHRPPGRPKTGLRRCSKRSICYNATLKITDVQTGLINGYLC